MNESSSTIKSVLIAGMAVAVIGFTWRMAVVEGTELGLALCVVGVVSFFCLWSRKVFTIFACCALASLNLNLLGIDPGDVLIPSLLFMGIILGHLNIRLLRFPSLFKIIFAAFCFFYSISIIDGNFVPASVGHLVLNIAFLCFLKLYVDSAEKMRHVLISLLVGAGLTSILAIAAIVGIWVPGGMFFETVRDFRYMSLLGEPNILALLTVMLALWLLDELLDPKLLDVPRWMTAALLILVLAQIGLTLSRSGWLNLMVGLFCYEVWDVYKGRIKRAFWVGSAVISVLSASIGLLFAMEAEDVLLGRIESFAFQESIGEQERFSLAYTKNAIDLAFDHPFGVGAGLTGQTLGQVSIDGMFLGAHNSYVQILSDNGWGPFFALLAMLAYIGFSLIARMKHEETKFGLSYQFLISGLAGLARDGMFHDLMEWNVAWILPALATIVLWPRFVPARLQIAHRGPGVVPSVATRLSDQGAPQQASNLFRPRPSNTPKP